MYKRFLLIILTLFALLSLKAQVQHPFEVKLFPKKRTVKTAFRATEDHSKLVAAGLDLSLGLFGVHRLYLGTSPQVPVIYALTLGGGGFLMLTDLGVIIFTKDLEQFANDPHVIMWGETKSPSK